MANKAFAIQGADLTLAGVNLQAGTTGVVIPGVTQATSYKVEEVEDNGDQTVTFSAPPIVIDYTTYLDYDNNGTSVGRAEYIVEELDDDGYIDDIEVTDRGSYTVQESNANDGNDLFAYTGTESNPFTTFVSVDWTQIPFRPKMRAGEVETIGGGGGSSALEGLDDVQLDGPSNGQVLTWNGSQEKWENQDPSGGGNANTGNVVFEDNTLYVGGTGFLNLENGAGQAVIGTNGSDPLLVSINEGDVVWTFSQDGRLYLPGGEPSIYSSDNANITLSTPGTITLNNTGGTWDFNSNGDLVLPENGDIKDSNGNSVLGGGSGPIPSDISDLTDNNNLLSGTTKSWTTPNSTTWTIEEYSGGWAGGFNHPIAEITYTMVEDMSGGDNFLINIETNPEVWTAINNSVEFVINGVTTTSSGYGVTSYPDYRVNLNAQVSYVTGDTMTIRYRNTNANPEPEVWWDADNSASGNNNFRGAIIEYHALCGAGTIIGKIFIAADDENAVTHMESMSGSSNLSEYEFWYAPNYGQLAVRRVGTDATNDDTQVWIQWTSKIFYSSEYDC